MDSSPGLPWALQFKTNQEMLDTFGLEQVVNLVYDRLRLLREAEIPDDFKPAKAVDIGLVDPIRVFVKNELHKVEKIKEGRFRLIASVSFIDGLVERVLFGDQNKAEIKENATLPSKPGMGLHDEGLEAIRAVLADFKRPISTDVSGFDQNVPYWAAVLDAKRRIALAGCTLGSSYAQMVLNRTKLLWKATIVFSDGTIIYQTEYFMQKSGSYNTSSSNSAMRKIVGDVVGANKRGIYMGDDAVEDVFDYGRNHDPEFLEHYKSRFAACGLAISTDYVVGDLDSGLEFCSHRFGRTVDQCYPVNPEKLTARLLVKKPQNRFQEEQLLAELRHDLRHHPRLPEMLDVIVRVAWPDRTKPLIKDG